MNKWWLGASLVLGLCGQANALTLSSKDMSEGNKLSSQLVFNGFGCQGENISPQLTWTQVPAGTQAFAVTAYDPMRQRAAVGGTGPCITCPQRKHHWRRGLVPMPMVCPKALSP
jgi:hypothetical protein